MSKAHGFVGRPVVLTIDIDGRKYRFKGSIWEGSVETALTGTLKPLRAPPPFARATDATVVTEEGSAC